MAPGVKLTDPKLEANSISGTEEVDWNEYDNRWDNLWKAGVKPGERWDQGFTHRMLKHLLENKEVNVSGLRTLVPGCGRGYDVVQFAASGAASSTGLEVSPIAVSEARSYINSLVGMDAIKESAHIVEGNFFTYEDPAGAFDVGYDLTFFCAMHPTMRATWASSWARLLKPQGLLVTLCFPVDPSKDPNMGPPFAVTPELYTEFLTAAGFVCERLTQIPEEMSHPSRAGKEWLGLWRRQPASSM